SVSRVRTSPSPRQRAERAHLAERRTRRTLRLAAILRHRGTTRRAALSLHSSAARTRTAATRNALFDRHQLAALQRTGQEWDLLRRVVGPGPLPHAWRTRPAGTVQAIPATGKQRRRFSESNSGFV